MFITYPIWKPAPSYHTDLGCGIHPTDYENYCWDNENKMKFFGTAGIFVNLDSLIDGTYTGYPSSRIVDFHYTRYSFKLREVSYF